MTWLAQSLGFDLCSTNGSSGTHQDCLVVSCIFDLSSYIIMSFPRQVSPEMVEHITTSTLLDFLGDSFYQVFFFCRTPSTMMNPLGEPSNGHSPPVFSGFASHGTDEHVSCCVAFCYYNLLYKNPIILQNIIDLIHGNAGCLTNPHGVCPNMGYPHI